jgi:hypothetical protein
MVISVKLLMLGGVTPGHRIGDAPLEYDGHSDDETASVIPQINDPNQNNPNAKNPIVNNPNENLPTENNLIVINANPLNLNGKVDSSSRNKRFTIDLKTPMAKSELIRPKNDDRKGDFRIDIVR